MGEVFSWCEREQWEKFSPRFMNCPIFFLPWYRKAYYGNCKLRRGWGKNPPRKNLIFHRYRKSWKNIVFFYPTHRREESRKVGQHQLNTTTSIFAI
jgi:hypothetical protein